MEHSRLTTATLPTTTHQATGWDRAAVLALGAAGCALSYDALQQMAVAIHVRGLLTYLFPLVIDGFIAYGVRALLVLHEAPFRARLYVWTLFGTATTASIWANSLHAIRLNQQTGNDSGLRLGDATVGILSTIAPLALAGAVHLHILITRRARRAEPAESGAGLPAYTTRPEASAPTAPEAVPPSTVPQASTGDQGGDPPAHEPTSRTPSRRVGRPASAEVDQLIAIGRQVDGKRTRETVAAAIRADGHTVSDKRLTQVMAALKVEPLFDPAQYEITD